MRLRHWLSAQSTFHHGSFFGKPRRRRAFTSPSRTAANIGSIESLEERTLLATFTVDLSTDENDGNFTAGDLSLREALFLANTDGGTDNAEEDTILFAPSLAGQTIVLSSGDELNISDTTGTLTIVGLGADQIAISGNNASRVLHLNPGASLQLSGVTIREGRASNGAGILNRGGNLVLSDSLITANTASSGQGGGLRNIMGGTLRIERTTIAGNSSDARGGGIYSNGGSVVLLESTISGNTSRDNGGGIQNESLTHAMTVRNSTVSRNVSTDRDGGGIGTGPGSTTVIVNSTIVLNQAGLDGGGIAALGTEWLVNTIVAGNVRNTTTPDEIDGAIESAFHNLIGNAETSGTIAHGVNGNIVGNAGVGTIDLSTVLETMLANNGGPTRTHALVEGSPAINAGDNARATADGNIGSEALMTDQRGAGFPRIEGDLVDIGAFEFADDSDLALEAEDLVEVKLQGNDPGTGYDQLVAAGDVTLNNAMLSPSRLESFVPAVGQEFVIIDNQGENAINGTFLNLPDESILTIGGVRFRIDYDGGTGNDVVLTVLAPDAVFVDEDFSVLNPPGPALVFGYDAFATIQEGVNQAARGGSVFISEGIYSESVTISKNLMLEGSGLGTVLNPLGGNGLILNQGIDVLSIQDLQITNASTGILDANPTTMTSLTLSHLRIADSIQGGQLDGIATLTVTLSSDDETVHIEDSQFQSTGLEPVKYANISNLVVNGAEGSDVFHVSPISNTDLTIHGGEPSDPTSPGDVLVYQGQAQMNLDDAESGTIFPAGFHAVSFTGMETLSTESVTSRNGDLILQATDATNEFLLRLSLEGNLEIVVDDLGAEAIVLSQPLATVNSLALEGSSGDDTLTIDFLGGNPIPIGGLVFRDHGINDQDLLRLRNGSVASIAHHFLNAQSGTILVEPTEGDVRSISYSGLGSIDDGLTAVDRRFDFTEAAELITLSDTETGSRISSASSSEPMDFANPTGSLTINSGGGDDTLTLLELDDLFAADLTVRGGLGRDTFDLEGMTTSASSTYTLNGEEGADTFNIAALGGSGPAIVLNGDSPGIVPGDTLNYDGPASVIPGAAAGRGTLIPDSGPRNLAFSTIETLNLHNPPTLSIFDASITEPASGPAFLNFTVALSNGFIEPVMVQVGTLSGTATGGIDFANKNQVLTFSPTDANLDGDDNILTQRVSVAIAPDSTVERDEDFLVLLSNASGAAILDGIAIGRIVDNNSATISIEDVSASEDGALAFAVTLSNAVSETVTVEVSTAETTTGTQAYAASGVDFSPINRQILTFTPGGPLTQMVFVQTHEDAIVENAETFEVRLSNPLFGGMVNPHVSIADSAAVGTIENDDFATLSISDVTRSEGDGPFAFVVTLSNPVAEDVSVRINTLAGTATSGADFIPIADQFLTFTPGGPLSQVVASGTEPNGVLITADSIVEQEERFFVRLDRPSFGGNSNDPHVMIAKNSGAGTILNDDQATLSIAGDASALESQGFIDFSVVLSNPPEGADRIGVQLDTIPASARDGNVDFTALRSQIVTFDFSQPDSNLDGDGNPLTKLVRIAINEDPITEHDETFFLLLSNPTYSGINDPSRVRIDSPGHLRTGTILDEDVSMLSISDAEAMEGGVFHFLVTLEGTVGEDVMVFASTDTGTGEAPAARAADIEEDYIGLSNVPVIFRADGPDVQTQAVSVLVNSDGEVEPMEDFRVLLSNLLFDGASGFGRVMFENTVGVGLIRDSDPPIAVSLRETSISDSEDKGPLTLTIDLSGPAPDPVTVFLTTEATNIGQGTDAVPNIDFTPASQVITFHPGEVSKTVDIALMPDNIVEPNETFRVRISDPRISGTADGNRILLGAETASTMTILNDDTATITIADAAIGEGDAGSSILEFIVTLSAPVQGGVILNSVGEGISADPGTDFTMAVPLMFAGDAASETQVLPVMIQGDTRTESNEFIQITLGDVIAQNPSAITVQSAPAVGTINNDDSLLVTAAGPGGGPHVRAFDQLGNMLFSFFAYEPTFQGGVRVATGDVTGDGVPDIITAPGPGVVSPAFAGPLRVFDGTNGLLVSDLDPYPGFAGGIYLTVADLDDDDIADIITAADAGGGPHVRAFRGTDFGDLFSFMAYDSDFTGGVRLAMGDLTGDGTPDIITAPGAGRSPLIRVFDGTNGNPVGDGELLAYAAEFLGGIYVAAADLNGDDIAEILTAPGAGGGPHVRIFDGEGFGDRLSFMAYDPGFMGGVFLSTGDLTGDGVLDLITAPGQGGGPHIKVFDATVLVTSPPRPTLARQMFAFDPGFLGGVFVAGSGGEAAMDSPLPLASDDLPAAQFSSEFEPTVFALVVRLEQTGQAVEQSAQFAQTRFTVRELQQDFSGSESEAIFSIDEDSSGLERFLDFPPLADEKTLDELFANGELLESLLSAEIS